MTACGCCFVPFGVGFAALFQSTHRGLNLIQITFQLYSMLMTAVTNQVEISMVLKKLAKGGVAGVLLRWTSRLRFPYLFLLTLLLFIFNLFIPDIVPFADEIIMGLVAALFGSLKKRSNEGGSQPPRDEQD